MRTQMDKTPGDPTDPIDRVRNGDRGALAKLFGEHRDRLRRMVELRIDARIDASDVLQEAFLDVSHDLAAYLVDPKLPPMLWLRLHVGRRYFRALKRLKDALATRPGGLEGL
jgi:RNA polymerase sigma-70 factor, ECF subfamily